jgi:glycosyltransferase involved in cell wall biosynthesis
MKILYDHEFFGYFGYSGIGRYFTELIRRLANQTDSSVHWFLGFHRGGYQDELKVSPPHDISGRRRIPIARFDSWLNRLDAKRFRSYSKKVQADIWHQSYFADLDPDFKGKRIVTVHDMTYEVLPERFPDSAHFTRQKRLALEKADGIIAISQSTRNDLVRLWNVPTEKICTILHGCSLKPQLHVERPLVSPYFMFVGQRVPHKNLATLLSAWRMQATQLEKHHFVCFGGGGFTKGEVAMFADLGLQGRVHQVSGDDTVLAQYYQHAEALVYPSLYEGFGLPVLEAITCGCPVIASKTSSLPEVGGDAALYFDPYSPEQLSKAMVSVLDPDSEVRADLKRKMPQQAARFSWERCAQETLAFYQRVLGRT